MGFFILKARDVRGAVDGKVSFKSSSSQPGISPNLRVGCLHASGASSVGSVPRVVDVATAAAVVSL